MGDGFATCFVLISGGGVRELPSSSNAGNKPETGFGVYDGSSESRGTCGTGKCWICWARLERAMSEKRLIG